MKKSKVPFTSVDMKRYLDAGVPDSMDNLLKELVDTYEFDYSSICQMIGMFAVIAANKANSSEAGGISGFQANGVMWEFIQNWMHLEGPMKLVRFDEMLYPQYEDHFQKSIDKETFKWMQEKAEESIKKHKSANQLVVDHWRRIVDGFVPFGYIIREEI